MAATGCDASIPGSAQTATLSAAADLPAYWRIKVTATVVYSDSNGNTWSGSGSNNVDFTAVAVKFWRDGIDVTGGQVVVAQNASSILDTTVLPLGASVPVTSTGVSVSGSAPGHITVTSGTNTGIIQAKLSQGTVCAEVNVLPLAHGITLTLSPAAPAGVGRPVLLNDTGHTFSVSATGWGVPSNQWDSTKGTDWIVAGANPTPPPGKYTTGSVPCSVNLTPNNLGVDTLTCQGWVKSSFMANGGPIASQLGYEVSTRIKSASSTSNGTKNLPWLKARKVFLRPGAGEVSVTVTGSVATSWGWNVEDSNGTTYTKGSELTAGVEAGSAIEGLSFKISEGVTLSSSIAHEVATKLGFKTGHNAATSVGITKTKTLGEDEEVVVYSVCEGDEYLATADIWPDANNDGVADGPAVTYTWMAYKNLVPGTELTVEPIPPDAE